VRSPFDGFEDDTNKKVVSATFWVNDIFTPSQLYVGYGGGDGNPWCPTKTTSCPKDHDTGDNGPWNSIQMGVVINKHMDKLFSDWGNVQKSTWDKGVFYPTDSNSADLRCAYFEVVGQYKGYDCPGGWIDADSGTWTPDSSKKGAGNYRGAGCHFNHYNSIDQTNAKDASGINLVGSYECQCEMSFKQDWSKWIDQWVDNSYLGGGTGASWQADLAGCWVNNPRDMINLQNQFYWKRQDWNNQRVPQVHYKQNDAAANRPYWGWNEVPVDRVTIADEANWDAVMIKLPAAVCGGTGENDLLSCVPHKYQVQFEKQLTQWKNKGFLKHEIVIAREYMDKSSNYFRKFFCQSWTSPNNKFKITYQPNQSCTIQSLGEVVV